MEDEIREPRNHHTQRKPMKNGKGGLETVIYTGNRVNEKGDLETTCGVLETFTMIEDSCSE